MTFTWLPNYHDIHMASQLPWSSHGFPTTMTFTWLPNYHDIHMASQLPWSSHGFPTTMMFTWLPKLPWRSHGFLNYCSLKMKYHSENMGTETGMRTGMQTKHEASLAIFPGLTQRYENVYISQCECGVKPGNKVSDALQNEPLFMCHWYTMTLASNPGFSFRILSHSFGEKSDFSRKLWDKIQNEKPGFEATMTSTFYHQSKYQPCNY